MKKDKDKVSKSRRKFIKGISSGALATAAAATVPAVGCSTSGTDREWSSTFDWVCVGSGVAGCAAAIAGHDQGFKTLLVEKLDAVGGTTSQSGGILWVPMNYLMNSAGITDSREEALQYLSYTAAGYSLPEYMQTFVDNAARVLEYLHQNADISFRLMDLAEFYHPFSPGSKPHGRLLTCEPFPAETLGAWRNKVRLSIFHHGLSEALAGQEHNPALGGGDGPSVGHSGPLRNSGSGEALWRNRLGPRLDAMLQKDEEHRVAGAALAAYLFRAVLQREIEVRTETSAEKLLMEDGRVVGVTIHSNGKEENIRANKGVVLATGGTFLTRSGEPGWRLAAPVGGAVSTEVAIVGMPNLRVAGENYPDGSQITRGNYELRMRHGLAVNRFGERFGDESFFPTLGSKVHHFEARGEHRFSNIPCYLVFDRNLLEKYSFAGLPPGNTEGLEWLAQGNTLAELAQRLQLPAAKLEASVARFNEHARRGRDSDFDRDPATLGPLEKPPFYGTELATPDPFRAAIRVVVNPRGQGMHYATNQPIAGLYACGAMIASGRYWGVGYQAGYSLMSSATLAFLAAEHAAATA